MLRVKEIQAKSILNKSKIFDYCINPYTGCQIACPYCYARLFMKRYSGHEEAWGDFVDIKINAPEVLKKQLVRAKRGKVWVSSVCDPYQPLEKKYRLTRSCLTELLEKQFPLNLQTKSALVVRDLDLLEQFREAEVGFTITTEDETMARLFEPGASSVHERINALEIMHSRGVQTFVFIGPILPGKPHKLVETLAGKVDRVYVDRMNYVSSIKGFYYKHGLKEAASDDFFQRFKNELVGALRKYQIPYDVFF
ncbi:MAG: radical SAM protein [Candidatus Aminicenantes bacterium]|jgi:DNA repair photolyase